MLGNMSETCRRDMAVCSTQLCLRSAPGYRPGPSPTTARSCPTSVVTPRPARCSVGPGLPYRTVSRVRGRRSTRFAQDGILTAASPVLLTRHVSPLADPDRTRHPDSPLPKPCTWPICPPLYANICCRTVCRSQYPSAGTCP